MEENNPMNEFEETAQNDEKKKGKFSFRRNKSKKERPNATGLFRAVIIVLVTASLGMNIFLFTVVMDDSNGSGGSSNSNTKVETVNYDVKSSLTDVINNVADSVVGVVVYSNGAASGSGSGVVYRVNGNSAYIITNEHVVSDASEVQVVFANGESVTANVVGGDTYSDIAVLQLTADFEMTAIDCGDSSKLETGETVLAIGSPLGIEYAGTVTQGIVSGTDRTVSVDLNDDGQDDWDMNVIQTDAAINPGNSGGALVNMKGELVGITNMKFAEETVEGMGFAIPVNDVISVAKQIRLNGKVSYPVIGISGVSLADYSAYQLQRYGVNVAVNTGLYVVEATNNGPAQKAGIQSGDVIVKVENTEITTYKSFLTELYSHKPGDTIEVTINRSGTEKTVQVTLEEK